MPTPALDRYLILAFLHVHAKSKNALVGAIYAGFAERVERGGFDVLKVPRKGDGITAEKVNSDTKKAAPALAPTSELRGLTPTKEGLI